MTEFEFKENVIDLTLSRLKFRLVRYLTRRNPSLFLRGNDIISVPAQVLGLHEPRLSAFIDHLAKDGHGDFLLDIGANIGLISCQTGRRFREVHMYEPNPLCCHILEVNASIALDRSKYFIHPCGLGNADETSSLMVPKHNWGGAFIRDEHNLYDANLLARKDGFGSIDHENYLNVEIMIKEASAELVSLFRLLGGKGLRSGVIKIDVEGYEMTILKGIAKSLPPDMRAYIIFESWDPDFAIRGVMDEFRGRATASRLRTCVPWKRRGLGLKSLCSRWGVSTRLEEVGDELCGDMVLKVDQVTSAPSRQG